MGKPTGFQEWQRREIPARPVAERLADWAEVHAKRDPAETRRQAGRCMDCGVPFCHQGCPLGNRIPDWNDLVWRERWEDAFRALASTNNFPEFTGRICPAPCEAACVLAINGEPVTIEHLEKEIAERAWAEGWIRPRPPSVRTGKRIAVVGSGPAGLAAADQLNRAGHTVIVFERDDRPGGLLRYGIPDFKLDKRVVDRRIELLRAEGVVFRCGVDVGTDVRWDALRAEHDAVLVAVGAGRARDLDVPGRDLPGVTLAMDFLRAHREGVHGKRVIVLGGGDTGSDCLGTALRQGAAEVVQIELLAAPPAERRDDNPWPQWPFVYRTSTSQEEGGVREWGLRTTGLSGDGRLERLHAVRSDGAEVVFDVDVLVLALGFVSPVTGALVAQLGVGLDGRGNVAVDAGFRTSAPGVYAAGDAHRGASLVVWAIAEGREAARTIDADLVGAARLPTRGDDRPYGGR